ncbi:MAG TPA: holo-ACP synthase [Holophagaceae bacterium]
MILGIGTDLCPPSRWRHLVERFGAEKCAHRILHAEEAAYLLGGNRDRLAERLAGRWALREAFGKALGVGLEGWSWKDLRYRNGKAHAEGALADLTARRGIRTIHASVSHDGDLALAFVVLEG